MALWRGRRLNGRDVRRQQDQHLFDGRVVGDTDLADGGEVGQQHRQGWLDLVEQSRDFVASKPGPVVQHGAQLGVVRASWSVTPARLCAQVRMGRWVSAWMSQQRRAVVDEGAGAVGDAVEVVRSVAEESISEPKS